jgi:hypothetical protein
MFIKERHIICSCHINYQNEDVAISRELYAGLKILYQIHLKCAILISSHLFQPQLDQFVCLRQSNYVAAADFGLVYG